MTTPQMEFAQRCAAVAADLALAFAGQPDEQVTQSLDQMRTNLQTELENVFDASVDVPRVVELFIDAVLVRKREIEAAVAAVPRAMN
jgi:hypothetical protein